MYSIEVHLVDHCNLNCESCTHFCPVSKPVYADITGILRDLLRLNAIHCTPQILKLLGGEPLLHPELTENLWKFRGMCPNSEIIIWTNGLKLPKMPNMFFKYCELFNIKVVITPYFKTPEVAELVQKYSFISYDPYFNGNFWTSPLRQLPGDAHINYEHCWIKTGRCTILREGKLYQCAFPAYIDKLNERFNTSFQVQWADYVDIYEVWNEKDILEKLYQATPFCRYCSKHFDIKPWKESQRQLSEWVNEG